MSDSGRELAWRLHGLQEAWIARVDIKASILLALEGGFLIAASSTQGWLAGGAAGIFGLAAMVLLIVAAGFAGAAVLPIMGSRRKQVGQSSGNVIYFGHLRHWSAERLAGHLSGLESQAELDMVARQVIVVSKLNWVKHRLLQISVILTLVALGLMAAGLLSRMR